MVNQEIIEKFTDRIVKEFDPEKVILFGSQAYGLPREDSDVDLLIILSFEGSSFRKSLDILNRLDPHFPIDLIARRPDETASRYEQGDPLIREALDKGKVLYERRH
jgi:predicted nucleotidyltransferase